MAGTSAGAKKGWAVRNRSGNKGNAKTMPAGLKWQVKKKKSDIKYDKESKASAARVNSYQAKLASEAKKKGTYALIGKSRGGFIPSGRGSDTDSRGHRT